ncbi:unnamed protein product, partial [Durusdinium trenchii]
MMGALGMLTQSLVQLPGFEGDESKEPGNFGNPLPWFDDYSDEMRAREINNGRIAMFSAIGQIAAGLYTGKVCSSFRGHNLGHRLVTMAYAKTLIAGVLAAPCVDAFVTPGTQGVTLRGSAPVSAQSESNFGAYSALAAASAGVAALGFAGGKKPVGRKNVVCNFSKETQIGAMDPVGFFDPLDFCKDEATFKDLRAKEIKHGRLAMMGALGMLTQSLVQLPGFEGVPKDVTA